MFNDKFGLTQAVLEGRKTQTRRVITQTVLDKAENYRIEYFENTFDKIPLEEMLLNAHTIFGCRPLHPYIVGEEIAIAQSYESCFRELQSDGKIAANPFITRYFYDLGWNNKMFVRADLMPHRIKITNVRVERLQDISDEDCLKEGISVRAWNEYVINGLYLSRAKHLLMVFVTAKAAFAALIKRISGKRILESNPFVFVYEFELIK